MQLQIKNLIDATGLPPFYRIIDVKNNEILLEHFDSIVKDIRKSIFRLSLHYDNQWDYISETDKREL